METLVLQQRKVSRLEAVIRKRTDSKYNGQTKMRKKNGQNTTRKIEQREPHWKPWVNSSVPEGLTFPAPPVVPEYITFTVRRMCIMQTQRNYRTFLQLIFIILTNSSYSSLKRKTGHKQDYINTHTHILYHLPLMKCE